MKILIAEDDAVAGATLRQALCKRGHDVSTVERGLEAWDHLISEYFPVLITDFRMPDIDGTNLTKLIRARPNAQYTYIIMLTAHSELQNYFDAIAAGIDDFLAKPLDIPLLVARLHVAERIIGLQNRVKQFESIMPVCCYCKKVRDGELWVDLQAYVAEKYGTMPSHGICPSCYQSQVEPELKALEDSVESDRWPAPDD